MMSVQDVSVDLDCKGFSDINRAWVTLDCDGRFGDKTTSRTAFSVATMAHITERWITFVVDDNEKIGGFCHAYRVILSK